MLWSFLETMNAVGDWLLRNLNILGNIAAICAFIITAFGAYIGVNAYWRHLRDFRRKRLELEAYLVREKQNPRDKVDRGQRTLLNIIRHVGLTEEEILKISFESDKIERRLSKDENDRFADRLLFEYVEKQ